MPPKGRVARGKARAKQLARRALRVQAFNARGEARRKALRTLNGVVQGLGFESLRVDPKAPDANVLHKLCRFLARRDLEQPLAEQCRQAVELFTANGGKLPDGFTLSVQGAGLASEEEGSPVVPRHKAVLGSEITFVSRF